MSAYSPVDSVGSPDGSFVPTDRFEVDQYVRVLLANGRTEIGMVSGFENGYIVVTTIQGYDFNVLPRNVKRAFLLVLDLNGVLVARGKGTFVHRPYVEEFMRFAFSNFAVAVWTSGLERSSNPIIESVFGSSQDRLLFKWYRDSCTERPTPANPFGTVKNLQRIFSQYPESFHSVNTIIVDDSPDKCSHPDIALCPVPFNDPALQKNDDGLKKAIDVLKQVLALDSHSPLIVAAEERLAALRANGGDESAQSNGSGAPSPAVGSPQEPPQASSSGDACGPFTASGVAADTPLEEIYLWKSRLCCEYLSGRCSYGMECRYSHDEDDGKRPCSRKNMCVHGHASRWVATASDGVLQRQRKERGRYYDKADLYFRTEMELGNARQLGSSHTGIPSEDARLENEARLAKAQKVSAPALQPMMPDNMFSTNPDRQRRAGQQQSENWHGSYDALVSKYNSDRGGRDFRGSPASAQPSSSSSPVDGSSSGGNGMPQGGRQRGGRRAQTQARNARFSGGVSTPTEKASPSQSSGPASPSGAASPTQRVYHFVNDANDTNALFRQLQALESQRTKH